MKCVKYRICYFATMLNENKITNSSDVTFITLPYELNIRNVVRIEVKLKKEMHAKRVVILNYEKVSEVER